MFRDARSSDRSMPVP